MQLVVVIPARDEAARIEAAIASARAPGVEVVVVDGGSRDGTPVLARRAGARVIGAPAGRARQLQRGVDSSCGEALLFLHADSRLAPGWAGVVRETLSDPGVAGGAFTLRFDERSFGMRVIEAGAALRARWLGLSYGDQALFTRRAVLEALGGVPQAPLMEDLDLARALRRAGRFVLRPEPVVTSARRYRQGGVARTWLRNALALAAFGAGLDRRRIAAWYRAAPRRRPRPALPAAGEPPRREPAS